MLSRVYPAVCCGAGCCSAVAMLHVMPGLDWHAPPPRWEMWRGEGQSGVFCAPARAQRVRSAKLQNEVHADSPHPCSRALSPFIRTDLARPWLRRLRRRNLGGYVGVRSGSSPVPSDTVPTCAGGLLCADVEFGVIVKQTDFFKPCPYTCPSQSDNSVASNCQTYVNLNFFTAT